MFDIQQLKETLDMALCENDTFDIVDTWIKELGYENVYGAGDTRFQKRIDDEHGSHINKIIIDDNKLTYMDNSKESFTKEFDVDSDAKLEKAFKEIKKLAKGQETDKENQGEPLNGIKRGKV